MALVTGHYPPCFSAFTAGRVTTGAAAALGSLAGIGLLRLTAPSTNTAPIYFGHDSTVTAATGIPIEAGTEKFLFIDSLAKVFVFSAAAQSVGFEAYR